ncbi:hypothetical protein CCM_04815 [Cordyceps militaris CM01]|uniref:Uncharacterized protein n=1 Tax=Cordyceps militaris (strain CM01) TaxID=983644 RepID=G3JEP4_CORMM|nr:uncharacterized protein CCM_04815 [Cordyceps militaris CM01]EGX93441.1 hypothetical protein CCM_04815 [Cordyceps militaris CM01]
MHWEAHKKKPSSAVQRRQLAVLDISRLAGWLTQIPERLGANELLEKAASAFLDAFDCLQSDEHSSAASPAYAVAMECLQSVLKDQHQAKSPNPLAAIFKVQIIFKERRSCTCQLLNDTVEEYWGDTFAQSRRHGSLIDLPKGVWLAPVALFASWIATDDPDIPCSLFSIIKESNQYWAEPAYIEPGKALKKQILQLRANTVMEQGPRGLRDFGLCVACGAGNQGQDAHHSLSLGIDPHGETFSGQLTKLLGVHYCSPST